MSRIVYSGVLSVTLVALVPSVGLAANETLAKAAVVESKPALASPDCNFCPEIIKIPEGEFWMGSDASGHESPADEKPRYKAKLFEFGMAKFEVTQGEWRQIMGNNPSAFPKCGDNCPVDNVSWNDVQKYIARFNQMTHRNCRLPTEVEWEYACRSGGLEQNYCGANDPEEFAWFKDNAKDKTHPVGGKKPNGLGLHDMTGNVWEWTSGSYTAYPLDSEESRKRLGFDAGLKVLRGGAWMNARGDARSAVRAALPPGDHDDYVGFRLVCPPPR